MSRPKFFLVLGLSLVSLAGVSRWVMGQAPPRPANLDLRKEVIERSPKALLAKGSSAIQPAVNVADDSRVEAGKVNWHASFTRACEASKKSAKPVFLFQLLGRLDERFC